MTQVEFIPQFVDTMPEQIDSGRLYISIRFRTASHLCACDCGTRVVTPIKPAKWEVTYDGETVSLWPSIGLWQLPCKSHYIIRRNKVIWARSFSRKEMERVRRKDAKDLQNYYQARRSIASELPESSDPVSDEAPPSEQEPSR